ncbi:hypothetical protein MKW98_000236 [Papaver atlanticum]|uniref:RRM domain-containing protein n=1 Tax=Papaver atlanticum TaxID=357466 RepID=A0AAD4XKG7_9MAGN|nr:hypothetical protein MKW98_000236 [Papaver atlanticum]
MDEDAGSMSRYLLDPSAQEFRPSRNNLSSNSSRIPLNHQPIYYSHPVNTTGYYDGLANYQEDHYQSSPTTTRYARPVTEVQPLPPLTTAATRALLLTSVPSDVNEMIVRRDMEVFGDIRAIQMERLHSDGIVTVHFYDLRHAQLAMKEIQEQHMQHQIRSRQHYNFLMGATNSNWDNSQHPNQHSHNYQQQILSQPAPSSYRGLVAGRVVWAQFTVPVKLLGHGGRNQGTIVVFNLDSGVSMLTLKQIFEAFGTVKELRETPSKKHQKFIEFYDIRDAARALSEMDGKEIEGKRVMIEFSRPGGYSNKMNRNSTTTANKEVKARSITDAMSILSLNKNKNNDKSGSSSSTDKKKTKNKSKNKTSNGDNYTTTTTEDVVTNKEIKKSCSSSGSSSCSSSNRSWKSNRQQMKGLSSNLLIDEAAIMESNCIRDTRTTVMIKNIPNKYSQKLLLIMLDNHCSNCNEQIKNGGGDHPLSSYDFVYLPIDFNNKCNVGYGFVNLTSPQAAWRLYKAFHSQSWEVFNSKKICAVTYARLQGLEALEEHFKNSKFACETEEYLPVVFSPPRDGKDQLTDPVAVSGLPIAKSERNDDDDDDDGTEEDDRSSMGLSDDTFVHTSGSSSGSSSILSTASNIQMEHQEQQQQLQLRHPMAGDCR